jgi:hypothetical protein
VVNVVPPALPDALAVPSDTPAVSAAGGQSVTVAGHGFGPNQVLPVEFHSRPLSLGPTTSDASGAYRATVTIPADAEPGPHRIVVSGLSSAGSPMNSVTAVQVRAGAAIPPGAAAAGGPSSVIAGPVAFTGAGMAPWLAVLGLLALFGGSVARRMVLRGSPGS